MSDTAHPITSLWTNPRGTILRIVANDPEYGVFALTFLAGISLASFELLPEQGDAEVPVQLSLPVLIIAGPASGFVALYLGAWLLSLAGGLLGGTASSVEIRTVIAWSNAPVVLGAVAFWILTMAGPNPVLADFLAPTFFLVFFAWSYLILALGLAAVQGFSIWKSMLSMAGAGILTMAVHLLGPLGAVWVFIAGLFSMGTVQ